VEKWLIFWGVEIRINTQSVFQPVGGGDARWTSGANKTWSALIYMV